MTNVTPRQRQVLELLAKRYSNQQIADELGISLEGAKWHVREVLGVMGVASREEAAELWRIENGLPRRLWRMSWGAAALGFVGASAATAATIVVAVVVSWSHSEHRSTTKSLAANNPPATFVGTVLIDPPATFVGTVLIDPTPALTPSPPTAEASAPVLLPPSRSTGEPLIDMVASLAETGEVVPRDLIAGEVLACSTDPFTTAPQCPEGGAPGARFLSAITFQCEIKWNALSPDSRIEFLSTDHLRLHSVMRGGAVYTRPPASDEVPDFWMLFRNDAPNLPPGFAVAIKGDKVVSWGRSCGSFDSLEARLVQGASGYLLPPP